MREQHGVEILLASGFLRLVPVSNREEVKLLLRKVKLPFAPLG